MPCHCWRAVLGGEGVKQEGGLMNKISLCKFTLLPHRQVKKAERRRSCRNDQARGLLVGVGGLTSLASRPTAP